MNAYNKLIGSVLGGIVGLVLLRFGLQDSLGPVVQPYIDGLTPVVGAAIGTWLAPRNVHPQ